MKIVNNTDTEIVITGPNATTFKRIFAGTSAHLDPNFDDAVISCDYGHIDIVMTSEFDGTFRVYPHGDLEAICEVDSESYDFVVQHLKSNQIIGLCNRIRFFMIKLFVMHLIICLMHTLQHSSGLMN